MGLRKTAPLPVRAPARRAAGAFVAIDFETADHGRDSACAVAMVRVEGDRIVLRETRLIRPPRRRFVFSYIHGIRWSDVEGEPSFQELWPGLEPILEGADFLVAHNAGFDRSVLRACCAVAGLALPATPFKCSATLSRRVWGAELSSVRLPVVCERLSIPLRHHDPASDAEACARIVLAAREAAEDLLPLGG